MTRRRLIWTWQLSLAAMCFHTACENSDIGDPCPELEVPNPGGGFFGGSLERSEGNQIVEYNINFPCESLVCVRTLGRDPMCSAECTSNAQCPTGFQCATVTEIGQFASRRFCVWSECESDADCGDPWTQYCAEVEEVTETGRAKFCAPRGQVLRLISCTVDADCDTAAGETCQASAESTPENPQLFCTPAAE